MVLPRYNTWGQTLEMSCVYVYLRQKREIKMRKYAFGLHQSQHLNVFCDLRNYLDQAILPGRDEVKCEAEEPVPPGPQGVVFIF